MLSARNQFQGEIKSINLRNVMAEVDVTVGTLEILSAKTRRSADQMALKFGNNVTAIVKSVEVIVARD